MDTDGFEELEDRADSLQDSLGGAAGTAAQLDAEMTAIRSTFAATAKDAAALERGMSRGLRKAFDGVVFDGMKLSDALETVAKSMINATYNSAIQPVTDHFGGMLANGVQHLIGGLLPFEKGGSFAQGRGMPFANGGVVSGPVSFPMRGGLGLMGEAGPEAIMPLARGADGKLGVRTAGGGTTTVVMNISTPDAQSFQRSKGQIAAQMSRAMSRANRHR